MKRVKLFLSAFVLSVSSLFVFAVPKTFATAKTWTGTAGDHLFSTAGNWSPSGAPTDGDTLTFPNGVSDLAPENDIVGLSVAGITFTGSDDTGFDISGNELELTGTITDSTTVNAPNTISADVEVTGASTFDVASGHYLTITGDVTGSAAVTKTGAGNLEMAGNNTAYSGAITISAGTMFVSDADGLGAASAGTTVASGGTLSACFTSDFTVAEPISVAGDGSDDAGAIKVASCGGFGTLEKTLTLSGAVTLTDDTLVGGYNGNILKITGALSGSYHITPKAGAAITLVLDSSNNTSLTPNGTVEAEAEEVTVEEGDDEPNTTVTVGANSIYTINGVRGDTVVAGTLKGTGTVGTLDIASGGIVAPGLSPGCLNSGDLNLGGSYQWEIGGTTACTEYDQLVVTGTVTAGGTLDASLYDGFEPTAGQKFVIVNNDGSDAVVGTFTDLEQGDTFTLGDYTFSVSYTGGDGNDIELTVTAGAPVTGFALAANSPIISAVAMLGAAGVIALLARRSLKPAVARRKR